jgi:hypothetical protein
MFLAKKSPTKNVPSEEISVGKRSDAESFSAKNYPTKNIPNEEMSVENFSN